MLGSVGRRPTSSTRTNDLSFATDTRKLGPMALTTGRGLHVFVRARPSQTPTCWKPTSAPARDRSPSRRFFTSRATVSTSPVRRRSTRSSSITRTRSTPVPSSPFAGSDRQGRGRLVRVLRSGPLGADRWADAAGWPRDPAHAARVASSARAGASVSPLGPELGVGGVSGCWLVSSCASTHTQKPAQHPDWDERALPTGGNGGRPPRRGRFGTIERRRAPHSPGTAAGRSSPSASPTGRSCPISSRAPAGTTISTRRARRRRLPGAADPLYREPRRAERLRCVASDPTARESRSPATP